MTLLKCVGQNQKHAVGFKNEKWFLNFELKDLFSKDWFYCTFLHPPWRWISPNRERWLISRSSRQWNTTIVAVRAGNNLQAAVCIWRPGTNLESLCLYLTTLEWDSTIIGLPAVWLTRSLKGNNFWVWKRQRSSTKSVFATDILRLLVQVSDNIMERVSQG